MTKENLDLRSQILDYYLQAEKKYENWGKNEEFDVYALHCGYKIDGKEQSHYEQVAELANQLVKFANIPESSKVLDSGCGTGAVSFEIKSQYPDCQVVGVNIAKFQLKTAMSAVRKHKFSDLSFSEQDFNNQAFQSETFDRVIFCESFTHSEDKVRTLTESNRILKPSGKLIISDTFLTNEDDSSNIKKSLFDTLYDGWFLHPFSTIENMSNILTSSGFTKIQFKDITPNIMESSRLMGNHAQLRLDEGNPGSETIQKSRHAAVACNKLFEDGAIAYHFISAEK